MVTALQHGTLYPFSRAGVPMPSTPLFKAAMVAAKVMGLKALVIPSAAYKEFDPATGYSNDFHGAFKLDQIYRTVAGSVPALSSSGTQFYWWTFGTLKGVRGDDLTMPGYSGAQPNNWIMHTCKRGVDGNGDPVNTSGIMVHHTQSASMGDGLKYNITGGVMEAYVGGTMVNSSSVVDGTPDLIDSPHVYTWLIESIPNRLRFYRDTDSRFSTTIGAPQAVGGRIQFLGRGDGNELEVPLWFSGISLHGTTPVGIVLADWLVNRDIVLAWIASVTEGYGFTLL